MGNKKKTVEDQIKALEKSITKFGDADGSRRKRIADLRRKQEVGQKA